MSLEHQARILSEYFIMSINRGTPEVVAQNWYNFDGYINNCVECGYSYDERHYDLTKRIWEDYQRNNKI